MSDLIERLRDKKRLRAAHGLTGWVLADESLHTEAADEIERLTAALQHEADCVEAAKEEIERLTAALQYEQHRAGRQGTHGDGCADWGPEHYECAIRERDELRRQLAEAEMDARRYRWLRENAVSYPDREHALELVVPMRFADAWRDDADTAIDAAMDLTRPADE